LGWWNFSDDDKKYFGLEESLDLLLKVMKEEGPFDGVFGFSQGMYKMISKFVIIFL